MRKFLQDLTKPAWIFTYKREENKITQRVDVNESLLYTVLVVIALATIVVKLWGGK